MKLLNGAEIASYIKVRQLKQVRGLRQAEHISPRLAIVHEKDDPVINTYVRLKQSYGDDILVEVTIHKVTQDTILQTIESLNHDVNVHGIIVQLPLDDPDQTEKVLNAVSPGKDVDGLGVNSTFDPATPTAINWLLTGYNVDLRHKKIVVLGNGRLVGAPLASMWEQSGYEVVVLDRQTDNITEKLKKADVIVSATGVPGVLKSDMVSIDSIVVDAGVASESGKTIGDVSPEVYDREDLTITPQKGGVGPLTVAALFDNVIRAARESVKQ